MIISKSPLNIAATIMCRNEEDIIGANIEHHINQGVKWFVVTNNNSTDTTRNILSKYPEVKEIIDSDDDTHNQSKCVTKMAKIANKLKPDWIIHLDADELWSGLTRLRDTDHNAFGSVRMFLHPPVNSDFDLNKMRYYLDFSATGLQDECKVGHRPDDDVVITHGNHGFADKRPMLFTTEIWRHHYPVRSCEQFVRKTVEGHEALSRRNAICERWEKWYNLHRDGKLEQFYHDICTTWTNMVESPNTSDLTYLLNFWSTPEVVWLFHQTNILPTIGQWPRTSNA